MIQVCDPVLFHTPSEEKDNPMLEHTFVRTGVIARLRQSPLGPHVDHFVACLQNAGYAPISIQRCLWAAEKFAAWLHGQGYSVYEMDEDLLRTYRAALTRYRSGDLPKAARGLRHLVRWLHQQCLTRPRLDGLSISPLEHWVSLYDTHLAQVAGFASSTGEC